MKTTGIYTYRENKVSAENTNREAHEIWKEEPKQFETEFENKSIRRYPKTNEKNNITIIHKCQSSEGH